MKKILIILLSILAIAACNKGRQDKGKSKSLESRNLVTQSIDYKEGNTALEGYLAYDPSIKGKRPAILLAHAWKGLDDYAKRRTRQLAKLG
ncbi:MAG TPA: hypothetical protein ENI73_06275, partial [Spirochaetes bacterium]|nr:hypothetical protein [Spirochaetota bacterium]